MHRLPSLCVRRKNMTAEQTATTRPFGIRDKVRELLGILMIARFVDTFTDVTEILDAHKSGLYGKPKKYAKKYKYCHCTDSEKNIK